MINFRYHIVSLMAVFIALSVGIAVGVSLSPSVDQGILAQAAQDREQVTELRTELDRVKALDAYRDEYAQQVGDQVIDGMLSGVRVALVSMPDAPATVTEAIGTEVVAAGGVLVREATVTAEAFDPAQAEALTAAVDPFRSGLGTDPTSSQATLFGRALSRSIGNRGVVDRDDTAVRLGEALSKGGWVNLTGNATTQAELVIVVTAEASDPRPAVDVLTAHVQFDLALKDGAAVVLAGPNSEDLEGTDVLAARSDPVAVDTLSSVDVVDLPSGVTTVVLAGKEQLNGTIGKQYGALAKSDAPLPTLPVR